jgi:hypothetical protein
VGAAGGAGPAGAATADAPRGSALDPATRAWFEPRLNADLGTVRVHADVTAAESARALHARAYTVDSEITFGAGQYAPGTSAGRRLLAHELAHVAQASRGGPRMAYRQTLTAEQIMDPQPRPQGPTFTFQGMRMSTDRAFQISELRAYVGMYGIQGLELWYDALQGRRVTVDLPFSAFARAYGGLRVRSPLDAMRDIENERIQGEIGARAVAIVHEVYPIVHAQAVDERSRYQAELRITLDAILQESERRMAAEAIRYGMSSTQDRFGVPTFTMQETVAFQALVGAATDLLPRRRAFDRAQLQLSLFVGTLSALGALSWQLAQLAELTKRAEELRLEYEHARTGATARHPVLAAVLDDATVGEAEQLEILARGELSGAMGSPVFPAETAAGAIGTSLRKRYQSIGVVREKVDDKPDRLWVIPEVRKLTEERVPPTFMVRGIVREKLHDIEFEESLKASFGIVIGLALAIPTGGGSLGAAVAVGGAAYGAYQAVQSLDRYSYEMALASTDMDKRARVISAEEPSAFWLALDLAGAYLDGHQALQAFKALRVPARGALAAAEGAEALEASARLKAAAREIDGTGRLGERLAQKLELMRGGPREARPAGEIGQAEARALARSAKAIEAETSAARTVASAAGHEVKVTRSGVLVVCTECTWMRERFAGELAGDSSLLNRFSSMEERAAKGALGDAERAELQALTADLQKARESRLAATLGPVGARAAAVGDLRAAYATTLGRRPALARELEDLETVLATGGKVDPKLLARADELRGRLEQLRNIDAISQAPRNARIVEVSFEKALVELFFEDVAEVVPNPPFVLEFPDGTRVWRDRVAGPIRHESTLGGSIGRSGLERMFDSRAVHANLPPGVNWERAHALGQGTGFESPYALWYAPEYVNQVLQNQGIEEFMRRLAAGAGPDETFRVLTSTVPHAGTRRLANMEYTIVKVAGGRTETVAFYAIAVGNDAPFTVTAAPIRFATTPAGQAARNTVSIPDVLRQAISKTH